VKNAAKYANPDSGGAAIAGVLLAGGLATRMGGGDKTLMRLGGRPVLAHLLDRLRPQAGALAISANGDASRFKAFGLPVVADTVADRPGPLAGILAGMEWAEKIPGATHIVSIPADTPFVPEDLVARLREAAGKTASGLAMAASDGRTHPPVALWPVALRATLARFLADGSERRVSVFAARHEAAVCPFDPLRIGGREIDPFFNINTPADLKLAEDMLSGGKE
jgi:molybdopterin-guanine dinucleotide biosynthesis protein A